MKCGNIYNKKRFITTLYSTEKLIQKEINNIKMPCFGLPLIILFVVK